MAARGRGCARPPVRGRPPDERPRASPATRRPTRSSSSTGRGSSCRAPTATASDVALVERLALDCGARPVRLDAAAHDAAVALISHLPLVVASALVEAAAQAPGWPLARIAGGPGVARHDPRRPWRPDARRRDARAQRGQRGRRAAPPSGGPRRLAGAARRAWPPTLRRPGTRKTTASSPARTRCSPSSSGWPRSPAGTVAMVAEPEELIMAVARGRFPDDLDWRGVRTEGIERYLADDRRGSDVPAASGPRGRSHLEADRALPRPARRTARLPHATDAGRRRRPPA